jgi:hypothetical protein
MSIKDLFKEPSKVFNTKPDELYSEIESRDYLKSKNSENNEFIPNVDFSDPKNFARFGLAEEYYTKAVEHIYGNYPFDGSEKEVTEWRNNLTYLEKYVLDNNYPKTAGYINLNSSSYASYATVTGSGITVLSSSVSQYVKVFSGPNSGSTYINGNIYNTSSLQGANLELRPSDGNTVESWFKLKSGLSDTILSSSFAFFDLWNGVTDATSANYSRFLVDLKPSDATFNVTYKNGSQGYQRASFAYNLAELTNWHHYGFTVQNYNSNLKFCFYVDGNLIEEKVLGNSISSINNLSLIANIGAYRYTPLDTEVNFSSLRNIGAIPGSFDEFRFWKIAKTEKDLSRYRFDRVYGGTNTSDVNSDLGLYFRFNEGILDSQATNTRDSVVLDYSGRLSKGQIVNYNFNVRSTSSAIDESGAFDTLEIKDPILFSDHPLVITCLEDLQTIGRTWDSENGSSIYKSLPEWITTEDQEVATGELKTLAQIIGSYFDKLYLQIKSLPTFEFNEYYEQNRKPAPFINTILESHGLISPDIFIDASIIQSIKDRDENNLFEEKVSDLKNLIYKNIYNNLTYIFKTKGTEKSFRNLLRSFGIDEELVKLNIYANNTEFTLENNKKSSTLSKKVLNFATPDSYYANIFNTAEVDDSTSNAVGYIDTTLNGLTSSIPYYLVPLTYETEIVFPKKLPTNDVNYSVPNATELSLFGAHKTSTSDYNISTSASYYNFDVYLVKNKKEDRGGYFKFDCLATGDVLTSSYYSDIYEGEKWNFAVRLKTPYTNYDELNYDKAAFDLTPVSGNFYLELYAVNSIEGNIKNEFTLTSSALSIGTVKNIQSGAKRFYVGSRRNNFTGTLQNPTDILVSSARFWFDYITNSEIKEHAIDSLNFGVANPLKKPYDTLNEKVERINTLGFNWEFDQLTSSNASGEALIKDSRPEVTVGGNFYYNLQNRYPAKVSNTIENYSSIVKKEYFLTYKPQIPENLYSSDTINIFGESDYAFTKETRPISLFWAFEKSMYQTISEDMLKMFAGIVDFNNLIGDPINKYRDEYRDLNSLRAKFFEKVRNEPDLEKYLDYYVWIDSAIGQFLLQLVPAGSSFSDSIRNMVESHVFERTKLKYNVSQFKKDAINYGQIKGIKELKYNWQEGHAPDTFISNISASQTSSSLWLKERAERQNSPFIASAGATADSNKQRMLESINNETNKPVVKVFDAATSITYNKTSYYDRKLAKVYDLTVDQPVNLLDNVDVYAIENVGQTTSSTVELRPFLSGSGDVRNSLYNKLRVNYNKKYNVLQAHGREVNNKYFVQLEGNLPTSSASKTITNIYDYPKLTRTRYEGIIVNKFSGLDGNIVLDREGETLSPYNTVNYRNSSVRNAFNKWNAETGSIDTNNPSYHKINKNKLKSADQTNFDNNFVSHQIPRSDYGYSWITSSTTAVLTSSGPYSSIYPNLNIGSIPFLTASSGSIGTIDFIGLNTNNFSLVVNTSSMTVSYTGSADLNTYLLKHNGPYGLPAWKQIRSRDNNPLVNSLVRNNKFIINKRNKTLNSRTNLQPFINLKDKEVQKTALNISYSASSLALVEPVVEWNYPLELNISNELTNRLFASNQNNELSQFLPVGNIIKTDYSNNIDNIANPLLKTEILPPEVDKESLSYKKIYYSYTSPKLDETEPVLNSINHTELILPRKEKISLGEIRTKPNYEEIAGSGSNGYDRNVAQIRSFWRDKVTDRARTSSRAGGGLAIISGSTNSLNYTDVYYQKGSGFSSYTLKNKLVNTLSTNFVDQINLETNTVFNSSSIWSLDNNYVFTGSASTATASFSSSLQGELAPYREFELRYFSMIPPGSYTSRTTYLNTVYLKKYSFLYENANVLTDFAERYYPRPQFVFINHRPAESYFGVGYDFPTSNIVSGKYYVNNSGLKYKTDMLSNNRPFYDSYEDFYSDLKPLSKNYTILPEFKISDFVEFYSSKQDALFLTPLTGNYLSLPGSTIDFNDIKKKYISTDVFNKAIIKENPLGVEKIKITADAALKLLPYKGFYPQDRSVQIVDLFRKSFFDLASEQLLTGAISTHSKLDSNLGLDGTPIDQQILTVLQPLFAPGVLFNTIKAGVAVDWPCYVRNSVNYSSSTFPEFYTTASSTPLSQSRAFYVLGSDFDYRMKFENILDINSMFPEALKENNLYYVNPTFYSNDNISGSDRNNIRFPMYNLKYTYNDYNSNFSQKNSLYNLGINNFVAEVPNFFLKNGKLNNFLSRPKQINVLSGTTYYMDVYLKRHPDCKQIVTQSISDYFSSTTYASFQVASLKESEFYGPPSKFWNTANLTGNTNFIDSNKLSFYVRPAGFTPGPTSSLSPLVDDPAYAPYTPPYYYGNSIARISYTSDYSGIVGINEIINNVSIEYLSPELENIFSASVISYNNQYTGSTAYKNRMKLDASINFKQVTNLKNLKTDQYGNPLEIADVNDNSLDIWSIQTKFETPVLNFNNDLNKNNTEILNSKTYSLSTYSISGSLYASYSEQNIFDASTLGIWSGYGDIPDSGKGVVFGIKESFSDDTYLVDRTKGSLVSLCGFEIGERDVGSIAATKEISEAIVLIPYIEKGYENFEENEKAKNILGIVGENGVTEQTVGAGPFYFSVDKRIIDTVLNAQFEEADREQLSKILLKQEVPKENSIVKSIKGMLNYNLPPQLDWVTNKSIDPFVMYFLEFNHKLNQQDLADVWQGLMPTISKNAELSSVSVEHTNTPSEFFHGKELPENIRFKVFKVKKKANINYYKLTDSSSDDDRFKFNFTNNNEVSPNYSYNWPYDFFSLIELANIKLGSSSRKPFAVKLAVSAGG